MEMFYYFLGYFGFGMIVSTITNWNKHDDDWAIYGFDCVLWPIPFFGYIFGNFVLFIIKTCRRIKNYKDIVR